VLISTFVGTRNSTQNIYLLQYALDLFTISSFSFFDKYITRYSYCGRPQHVTERLQQPHSSRAVVPAMCDVASSFWREAKKRPR